jgi:hypothetical protein
MAISVDRRLARDVVPACAALGIVPDLPVDDAWPTIAELLMPAALEDALETMHARWSTPDRRVDGAFLTGHLGWHLALALAGPWLRDATLLDAAPAAIAVHRGDGGLDGVAVDGTRTVVEGATTVQLEAALASHTELVVTAMRAVTPLGERAIRALTADAYAGAIQWAGQAAGDEARAIELASSMLRGPAWRWRGAFVVLRVAGSAATVQERGSCCLSYRCAGEEPCDGCPLRVSDDRRERLMASLRDARALD